MVSSKCDTCNEPTKCPVGFWDGYDERGNMTGSCTWGCDSPDCEIAIQRRLMEEDAARTRALVLQINAANGVDVRKLRQARMDAYCTIREASEEINCSAAEYSAYETGRASMPKDKYIHLYKYLKENRLL